MDKKAIDQIKLDLDQAKLDLDQAKLDLDKLPKPEKIDKWSRISEAEMKAKFLLNTDIYKDLDDESS